MFPAWNYWINRDYCVFNTYFFNCRAKHCIIAVLLITVCGAQQYRTSYDASF